MTFSQVMHIEEQSRSGCDRAQSARKDGSSGKAQWLEMSNTSHGMIIDNWNGEQIRSILSCGAPSATMRNAVSIQLPQQAIAEYFLYFLNIRLDEQEPWNSLVAVSDILLPAFDVLSPGSFPWLVTIGELMGVVKPDRADLYPEQFSSA